MSEDELGGAGTSTLMRTFLFKAKSQFELFMEARERYFEVVDQLKAKMKDVPLEFLLDLSDEASNNTKKTDPDMIPEKKVTVADAARREIHRRAFQGFTVVPSRKDKMDVYQLGFLRKPKS